MLILKADVCLIGLLHCDKSGGGWENWEGGRKAKREGDGTCLRVSVKAQGFSDPLQMYCLSTATVCEFYEQPCMCGLSSTDGGRGRWHCGCLVRACLVESKSRWAPLASWLVCGAERLWVESQRSGTGFVLHFGQKHVCISGRLTPGLRRRDLPAKAFGYRGKLSHLTWITGMRGLGFGDFCGGVCQHASIFVGCGVAWAVLCAWATLLCVGAVTSPWQRPPGLALWFWQSAAAAWGGYGST